MVYFIDRPEFLKQRPKRVAQGNRELNEIEIFLAHRVSFQSVLCRGNSTRFCHSVYLMQFRYAHPQSAVKSALFPGFARRSKWALPDVQKQTPAAKAVLGWLASSLRSYQLERLWLTR